MDQEKACKKKKSVSKTSLTRKKQKSIPKLKKELQTVFNSWIRQRDKDKKCITCNQPIEGIANAAHFFPVKGNDSLRFNENNVHASCQKCNAFNKEEYIWYTLNLPNRIGQIQFDSLIDLAKWYKKNPHTWTRVELETLKTKYKS